MSCFLSPLLVEDNDGFPVTLTAPLIYISDRLLEKIVVPTGFKTDFASIPRGLWNILPKEGHYNRPGVIHDWLYAEGRVSRSTADAVLREGCLTCGVPEWQARLIWLGVRLGGWLPWRRYRHG